jgi:hypothetical protein
VSPALRAQLKVEGEQMSAVRKTLFCWGFAGSLACLCDGVDMLLGLPTLMAIGKFSIDQGLLRFK